MNSKLTNEELQKVREVSIHQILGIQLSGRRVSLRCPFGSHTDRTPSFTLYVDNSFHCFGCGANGQGAIDFCVALGYTFIEACEELIKYIK
jgi:DNA primase